MYKTVNVTAIVALFVIGVLSICWLCPGFPQFILVLTSVFILVLWDACEMPGMHCCDSGWAMGLSCSGAPAEAQFLFVLWCIDPFRPPPECTPPVLALPKPARVVDLRVMHFHAHTKRNRDFTKPRLYFLLLWNNFMSSSNPVCFIFLILSK